MRQIHRAGEKLFIDYVGPTIALTDGSRAHIFVAANGCVVLNKIATGPGAPKNRKRSISNRHSESVARVGEEAVRILALSPIGQMRREFRVFFNVKGCAMPALKPHACERAGEPAGRRRTSLDGGNRGVLRCSGNLTRLWRLKRSHYQSGDGELRQTRR